MNVAFVSNVVYPFVRGGAEKRIHEIGRRLADRGHTVTIYCRRFWEGPRVRTHAGMTLRAVAPERELYVDGRRSIPEAIDFAARAAPPLVRNGTDHDLVVASVFPYFPVLAAKLSALSLSVPVVTTWHEVWGSYWEGYLGRLAPFGKLTERLTAAIPQFPIAVSAGTAEKLAAIGPARERVRVVPNGVDVERIRSIPPAENGFDVLFAGRLIEDKNVDLLLAAFDDLAEEHDATLGIIGNGPERSTLEAEARARSCSDRVSFLGFLEADEEVLAQMRAATVFVSPSTREGFGITYVEAMAAGCPVIGARHPDSAASEVIGEGGYLTEPTVSGIEAVLDRVLGGERPPSDPTVAAERYDWAAITDRAEAAYRDAIAEF